MKKLNIAIAMLLITALTACTGSNTKKEEKTENTSSSVENSSEKTSESKGFEPATITFNWWGGDSRHEATQKAVEAFMKKYPDIKVEVNFGAWTDWETARALEFQSGTGADLSQINIDWIGKYDVDSTTFLDINTVSDVVDLTQFDSKLLEISKDSKGGLAGVPIAETGRIFYWDKTTFDEAGIDTPKSLADLRNAGKIFKEKLGDDYYPLAMGAYDRAIFMAYYLQSKYNKQIFTDEGVFNFSEDEIKDGIEFVKSLEDDHIMPSIKTVDGDGAASFDVNEKFISGRYAGILEWDSAASKFRKALGDSRDLVVGEEFKDLGGKETGVFTKISMLYAINAKSKHPREAALLMNFLLNDSEGIEIIGTQRGVPASKVALEQLTKANAIDPVIKEAHQKVLEAATFNMNVKFDDPSLKSTNGLYIDIFSGLSYGDYTVETATKMLFDAYKNVSN